MYRDPTFDSVYQMECRTIKQASGCQSCQHRGEHLAWQHYACKLGKQKNTTGSCQSWCYREDQ